MLDSRRQHNKVKRFKEGSQTPTRRYAVRSYTPGVSRQETVDEKNRSKPNRVPIWERNGVLAAGICLLLLGAALYFSSYTGRMDIAQVTVQETQFISHADIQRRIAEYQQSRLIGIIPRTMYWSFDEEALANQLQNAYEHEFAVEEVYVVKHFPDTVEVTVVEKIPSVTWVTKDHQGNEHFYLIDRQGVVTREISSFSETNEAFPRVRDDNRTTLGIGWQIISPAYIEAVLSAYEHCEPVTGFELDSFIMPPTVCMTQEYVTERLFEQEISESESEEYKEKKRDIQEQFKQGQLTIDESLDALEQIKLDEQGSDEGEEGNQEPFEALSWEVVDKEVDCDYVKVMTDLRLVVRANPHKTFEIYIDTARDTKIQLHNAQTVIHTSVDDPEHITSVDVRIPDRAYIK